MSTALRQRLEHRLSRTLDPEVRDFAMALARDAGAVAVLFYGSNLRTGSLDGVLDFYLLLPGDRQDEPAIWPRVSYHERCVSEGGRSIMLRAKTATMRLSTFAKAAQGELHDTTIWARFVQPSALLWAHDEPTREAVVKTIADSAITAARLAAALGPAKGRAAEYWRALFQATYKAEFRVEKPGRENDILTVNEDHFAGLLPLALKSGGIEFQTRGDELSVTLCPDERARILAWWHRRRRLGKPLNFVRLAKASTTFDGAARYAAWKIQRHTGLEIEVTPFRERYPLLAAPGVLWSLWRYRSRGGRAR